ncbi:MAG: dTDP-4-dehydrorhamnose 3,5-epimerase [Bacteroidota bacterium]
MEIRSTGIEGLYEVIPHTYLDNRGWFLEFFKTTFLPDFELINPLVQDNLSFSKRGVVRGLHLQLEPFTQAKIVSVLQGKVLDVVVDLRKGSTSFGKVYSCILDSEKHNLLVIPEGFAHGFSALADSLFFYKCSNLYNPKFETGIVWNDPQLKIDWKIENPILSEKDQHLPTLEELLRKSLISPKA